MIWNRRQILRAAGLAALGTTPTALALAARLAAPKKVLFFTKSSGFQHSVITRKGDTLSHAEQILTDIGKDHGFEVVASKDGGMFEPDRIGQWDAFVFETTGDLGKPGTDKTPPISPAGERAFYDAVKGGKGFLGIHCATDTYGHHRNRGADDPFIQLIGGEFSGHGPQQVAKIEVVDPEFPGTKAFGTGSFTINDDWYGQMNLADDLHVILAQVTEGMNGDDYKRPNYPQTWARMHGKGRVFYTSMGHREDVWENPKFQALLISGLMWNTGQIEFDAKPNVAKVTPGYAEVPVKKKK